MIPTAILVPTVFPNGVGGATFITYGLSIESQRGGFWLCHIGLAVILAHAFGPLLPATDVETKASQTLLMNQIASLAMLLFTALSMVNGKTRR